MVAHRMTGRSRWSSPAAWKGPLLSVGLLVALVLGLEGLLRLLDVGTPPADVLRLPGQPLPEKSITLWDPDLYYTLRPSTAIFGRYHVNGHGVRGPEYQTAKPPGTLRVLCAGDSSTFGLGVSDADTWPAQVQRILDGLLEGSWKVEVINFGVPGYSTEQTRRQILRDGLALDPDAIVICPTAQNDSSWRATGGDRVVLDENSSLRARLDQWHLARLLGLGLPTESFRADAIRTPGSPGARPRVTPPEFAANLAEIIAAGQGAGAPVVLVVTEHHPILEDSVPDLAASEELTLQVAAEHGARAVDTRPDFALYDPYPMFSDRIHFVPLGQMLVARQVVLALLQEPSLLDAGPRSAFLRGWAAAHADGVGRHEADLRQGDRPPLFLGLLQAYDRMAPFGSRERIPGDASPAVRAAIEAHDPIWGPVAAVYGIVRAEVDSSGAAAFHERGKSDDYHARRLEIEAFVRPGDPLEVLGGKLFSEGGRPLDPLVSAVAAFDAAIGFEPPRRDRRLAQAIAARRAQEPEAALVLLDAVLKLDEACTEAHYERAQCLRQLGRRPESFADLNRVIELEPDSSRGRLVAGMLAFERGLPAEAEPLFRQAIALDATNARAKFALAKICIDTGRLDEAEELIEGAALIITDPVDVTPLKLELQQKRGQTASAGG